MVFDENTEIQNRIEKIRDLIGEGKKELFEAISLARSIVYDIRGDNHPLMERSQTKLCSGCICTARRLLLLLQRVVV